MIGALTVNMLMQQSIDKAPSAQKCDRKHWFGKFQYLGSVLPYYFSFCDSFKKLLFSRKTVTTDFFPALFPGREVLSELFKLKLKKLLTDV